MTNMNRSIYI